MFAIVNLSTSERLEYLFTTGKEAADCAKKLTLDTGIKHQVRPILTNVWHDRERARFQDGTYTPLPWLGLAWFDKNLARLAPDHFAHISVTKPYMVAFTETPAKGEADIQTPMKPGKYLERFFSSVLTGDEIKELALAFVRLDTDVELKFATSSEDIVDVYLNGPDSCMSKKPSYYDGSAHPVSVYGDSSLRLAYIENDKYGQDGAPFSDQKIKSRALVYEDEKVFVRVYPTVTSYGNVNDRREAAQLAYDELYAALEQAGYRKGSFKGATIRRIENEKGSSFIMPYLDGDCQGVDDSGDMFTITSCGDYTANSVNGLIDEEDSPEDEFICSCCEDYVNDDYSREVQVGRNLTETWCELCADHHAFYCHGSGTYYSDSNYDYTEIDGDIYERGYVSNNFTFCDHVEEYTSDDCYKVIMNKRRDAETWSITAIIDDAFCCVIDGLYYDKTLLAPDTLDKDTADKRGVSMGRYLGNGALDHAGPYHSDDASQMTLDGL